MEIAALIIAVMALMAATASLTLQVAIWKLKPEQAQPVLRSTELDEPSEYELGLDKDRPAVKTVEQQEARRIIDSAELNKLDEAFENPDVPYTGIDDEFGIS